MKRLLLLGTTLVLAALLMFSCNKNRFDFDQLETVEGSGQWKLPIGSARASLQQVLEQLNYNGMIQFDADSNLYLVYDYTLDNVLSGRNFMSLKAYKFETDFSMHNDYYNSGITIPIALKDTLYFKQKIEIATDSVSSIEFVTVESGVIEIDPTSNMFTVREWRVSSPDIINPEWQGDTLFGDAHHLDLAGATFNLTNDSIILNYVIICDLDSTILDHPDLQMHARVELKDLTIGELKGHLISQYQKLNPVDTTFFLPMNISGDIALKNAKLVFRHKNTFGGLNARVNIDTLEFYGEDEVTSPIFPGGFVADMQPTGDEFVESIYYPHFSLNTKHNSFRMRGEAEFNPGGENNTIVVRKDSEIGLGVGVEVPFSFTSEEGVYYTDTFDLDLSKIEVTKFIKEVVLHIIFDSQFPFNLNAQLYTLNDMDQITGQLLDNELSIAAWRPGGSPVVTNSTVSVTQESLDDFFESKKILLKANLNTGGTTASINAHNSLGLTLKADVIYGGSLEINQ